VHARRTTAAVLAAAALLLSTSCGKEDNSEESEPSASMEATSSPSPSATQSPSASPSATASATSTATESPSPSASPSATGDSDVVSLRIELENGKPTQMPPVNVDVEEGQTFRLTVSSDKAYEIHVHGYDESMNVPAGGEETLEFVADEPGDWEVEVEETHKKLFNLRVK
jgi:hypothetical protein